LHRKKSWANAPFRKAFKVMSLQFLFNSLHQLNAKSFSHQHTIQLFNRYATYNGSNPFKAPALFSLIPHLEMNVGTFYPQGGMQSIADALYKLAVKKGVRFYFNTLVQQINHSKGKVTGIQANNQNFCSDVVVSNMDIYFTHKYLLHNSAVAEKLLRQKRSSSAIIFTGALIENLTLYNCTIFFLVKIIKQNSIASIKVFYMMTQPCM